MRRNSGLLSPACIIFLSFQFQPSLPNPVNTPRSNIPQCPYHPSWVPPPRADRRVGYDRVRPTHAEAMDVRRLGSKHPRIIVEGLSLVLPTEEWFHRYMTLSTAEQKTFYSRFPGGVEKIRRLGRRRLHAWLKYFQSEDGAGLDHARLKKMVLSRPQLLYYALSNVMSTTAYFREDLGLSLDEYASMLSSYPSVLMYGVDTRLRPTVEFLQNECGGGRDNWTSWKRVVYTYPTIFSYSTERTLMPKLKFLLSSNDCRSCDGRSLGLSRSELSQVVSKFPPTLWLSEDNLRSKIDFLVVSLGLEGPDLRMIIVSYPQILGLSLRGNLMPKVDFFLDAGLSKDQLREFVLYQPALLAYSLEKRLRPRIVRLKERNISL